MNRFHQWILIGSTLLGSWLGMQAVHESGHVLGAWLTGARVVRVVLHPLTISRTDLGENPHPLGVVWAGPLLGLAIPLSLWACATWFRLPEASVLRFFAGFCLIANGLYISLGSVDQVGDCREMLRHGSSPWQLWLFGVVSVPIGFYLWHGQGRHFGWGPNPTPINSRVAYGSLVVFLTLLASGFFLEFRG